MQGGCGGVDEGAAWQRGRREKPLLVLPKLLRTAILGYYFTE